MRRGHQRDCRLRQGATRGEFAPPSLRRRVASSGWVGRAANEGRIRPSLIAACPLGWSMFSAATQRGANSPLPHCGMFYAGLSLNEVEDNEGRIRPSLIAALRQPISETGFSGQRGANSPLPHCGALAVAGFTSTIGQRGANSPLPHCGNPDGATPNVPCGSTRGEFAPPSLRQYGDG